VRITSDTHREAAVT